jgi:hypothetical protein
MRKARSRTLAFDSRSRSSWPAVFRPRRRGKLSLRSASIWLPRSLTIVCSSILQPRFRFAAGCNVREVSEWAGHNSVAFTLTRYGGLFEDGADAAVDRLDALLGGRVAGQYRTVSCLLMTQVEGVPAAHLVRQQLRPNSAQ